MSEFFSITFPQLPQLILLSLKDRMYLKSKKLAVRE